MTANPSNDSSIKAVEYNLGGWNALLYWGMVIFAAICTFGPLPLELRWRFAAAAYASLLLFQILPNQRGHLFAKAHHFALAPMAFMEEVVGLKVKAHGMCRGQSLNQLDRGEIAFTSIVRK